MSAADLVTGVGRHSGNRQAQVIAFLAGKKVEIRNLLAAGRVEALSKVTSTLEIKTMLEIGRMEHRPVAVEALSKMKSREQITAIFSAAAENRRLKPIAIEALSRMTHEDQTFEIIALAAIKEEYAEIAAMVIKGTSSVAVLLNVLNISAEHDVIGTGVVLTHPRIAEFVWKTARQLPLDDSIRKPLVLAFLGVDTFEAGEFVSLATRAANYYVRTFIGKEAAA